MHYLALRVRTVSNLVVRTYHPIGAVSTVDEEGVVVGQAISPARYQSRHGISDHRTVGRVALN